MSFSMLAGLVLLTGALLLSARNLTAVVPVLARSRRQRRRARRNYGPAQMDR